jgi:membrane-associated PAP2 superfamily phosphatase
MASFFALKQAGAKSALRWLILAMIAGFVLGISQQMRGAHFMSHTLWTAWLCWTMGWLSHTLFQQFFNPLGNR